MLFGKRSSERGSPSNCASALKRVSVADASEDGSVRSGSEWTSMQSYASWRSEDSAMDSHVYHSLSHQEQRPQKRPEPRSTLPRSQPRDAFVAKTISQLKNWMPGCEQDEYTLAADMERANDAIARTIIPDIAEFVPVHPSDPLLAVFGYLGVNAIAIALGASYFQRLLKKKQSMMNGACECGWFVQADDGRGNVKTFMRSVYSEHHTGLMVIYAVCCYVAAKLADRIAYKRQLSALLYALLDSPVAEAVAVDLEARVVAKLDWRLGPLCTID